MANPVPAPVKKKSGMGCFGCGCLIFIILLLLALGALGIIAYELDAGFSTLTSPAPTTIQSYDAGDDAYAATKQKMTAFSHDLNQHLPATIHLSGNEINTLLAHEPDLTKNNIRFFVTIEKDEARIQSSIPTSIMTRGWIKDRYLNGDVSFGLHFDPAGKQLNLSLQNVRFNDQDMPKANRPGVENLINFMFTPLLESDTTFALILQQAKTIEIKDGELVIETQ